MVRPVRFAVLLLALAPATPAPAAPKTTASRHPAPTLRAHVFDLATGQLQDNLFKDASTPSLAQYDQLPEGPLLLVVGLPGEDSGDKLVVTVKQGKKTQRFKLSRKPAAAEAWFQPILIDTPGPCDPMTIAVEVPGDAKRRIERKIDFVCGE